MILTAHRGGLYYRPENSLAAFENSVAMGIEWAECDIRLSHDLVPVLHHDDRIPLSVGGDRAVRELDAGELGRIDIGGGETVPTLRELLNRFGQRIHLDLELKELDAVEKVVALVLEMELAGRVIVSSFIPEALQLARDIAPQVRRGLLVDRLTGRIVGGRSAVKAGVLLGCAFFLPHYRSLSPVSIRDAQSEGMLVVPWTVNSLDEGRVLIGQGVDGLVSDRPDQFLPFLS